MNSHCIKALCKQLGKDFGHAQCAAWAGVVPSVWSDYCSYDRPDTTIPGHRMFLWQDKAGRKDFSRLFAAELEGEATEVRDPRAAASDALSSLARTIQALTLALDDQNLSEAEKRQILAEISDLGGKVHALSVNVAEMPVGRVHLRAVS